VVSKKQSKKKKSINEKAEYCAVENLADDYLKKATWEVKENSNIGYSWSGLLLHVAGKVLANYTLNKVYPKNIADAHRNCDLHIHNLYFGIIGYCAGWDLRKLLLEGFGNGMGKTSSKPAKHLDAALLQIVNFIGTIQNEWAGAQAVNSIDTLLAPFIRSDKLNYKQVKQAVQKFVFNLNISSRWGSQTPFTNITLDWTVPKDLKDEKAIVGGERGSKTYADYQKEIDMFNKAFIETMLDGDADKRPFTFPIPTYNLTKDFDWDSKKTNLLFELAAKYGLPYFSNFINSDLDPSDIRAMCCRLRLDLRELRRNITGGLFGSGDATGSIGVVTINMPRIAYLAKSEKDFYARLRKLMELAKESLEIKRKVVAKNIDDGLLPYTKQYLATTSNHFSTIGLIGMNEACLNFLDKDISTKEGKAFTIKTLKFMLKQLKRFQLETGNLYNLEATPAESTAYRLALADKKEYPKIKTAGKKIPYYTNSTWLPVGYTNDPIEAIENQKDIQILYTGGTVFHTFLGEKFSSAEACKNYVKKVFTNTKIPYITITPTYAICPDHGYIPGEHSKCPYCGKPVETYSRVVGYLRPVHNWNDGKREEFKDRLEYEEKKAVKGKFKK